MLGVWGCTAPSPPVRHSLLDALCTMTKPVQAQEKRKKDKKKQKLPKEEKVLAPKKLPVTLLSGFLGAGKTTLLKHILESNQHKRRIAVIVNDMAALNIDAALIEKQGMVQTKAEMVSMQNGCICCTLRTDLIREIDRLQRMNTFDYLVIESTGIAEPMQVAESFCANPDTAVLSEEKNGEKKREKMLFDTARLDTCVTVVDAKEFPVFARSLESFKERFPSEVDDTPHDHHHGAAEADREGEKNIAQLLIEQVEFANVLIVNKIDLVSKAELDDLLALLKTLNPHAKVIPTNYSQVPLEEILDTKLFSLEEASNAAGWLESLRGASQGAVHSEKDEYNVTSFVYKARRPFHPYLLKKFVDSVFTFNNELDEKKSRGKSSFDALMKEDVRRRETLQKTFGNVLRSKGFCWIAGRDRVMCEWSQQGRLITLSPLREWLCEQDEETLDEEDKANLETHTEGAFGDRRQEVVLIGTHLRQEELTKALDACLLSEEEMAGYNAQQSSQRYWDTLPAWSVMVDEQGRFSSIVRVHQPRVFSVVEGFELELCNISLNLRSAALSAHEEEEEEEQESSVAAVRVWLDQHASDHPSQLLCTLRPSICEQYPLSVVLPPVESTYELRVQVLRKRGTTVIEDVTKEPVVEVHVVGIASKQEKDDSDSEENEGGDEMCHINGMDEEEEEEEEVKQPTKKRKH